MSALSFEIEKKGNNLARAGRILTPHGIIQTPAFVVVGTKATVKALTPEQVRAVGAQVVLGNTYHLYLQPGDELVHDAGGMGKFMHWDGPTMTDSGGFQVFSLGAGMGRGNTKFETAAAPERADGEEEPKLATIDEDGVTFRSHIDGKEHRFTPERSMEIQHNLGADIMFAFDECTLPTAPEEYQREAMERTHRWAARSLARHTELQASLPAEEMQAGLPAEELQAGLPAEAKRRQALFGIVQGGRYPELRKESARTIAAMDFDGFGIGGSFSKEDLGETLKSVNELLPEDKPRHLLGIGEPEDLFAGIEQGIDTFDCVLPTRIARNGTLYTKEGKVNITNAKFARDFSPLDEGCACYSCSHFTKAYVSHLFRAKEMLAATLASIHNLFFLVHLVDDIRQSLLNETMPDFKAEFLARYRA